MIWSSAIKAEAERLLNQGLLRADVARRLGVPTSTLRSWFPDRRLPRPTTCEGCGAPIDQPEVGRPSKWCGEQCRKAQYQGECVDCGAPTDGGNGRGPNRPKRCRSCGSVEALGRAWATNRARHRERLDVIHRMWHDGAKLREIAEVLDSTPASIGVDISRMRGAGWDMPHRYSAARIANATAHWRNRRAA